MNSVGAIQSTKQIEILKKALIERSKRDYLLFIFSINTGLRLTPLLHLTLNHVMKDGSYNEFLESSITETTDIYLNSEVKRALTLYVNEHPSNENFYLFHTKKILLIQLQDSRFIASYLKREKMPDLSIQSAFIV